MEGLGPMEYVNETRPHMEMTLTGYAQDDESAQRDIVWLNDVGDTVMTLFQVTDDYLSVSDARNAGKDKTLLTQVERQAHGLRTMLMRIMSWACPTVLLKVDALQADPTHPAIYRGNMPEVIQQASIPIVAQWNSKDQCLVVADGHHRLEAARQLKAPFIAVVVPNIMDVPRSWRRRHIVPQERARQAMETYLASVPGS